MTIIFNRLHKMPLCVRGMITLGFLTLLVLMVRVAPWLRTTGQDLFIRIGFPQSEAAWLSHFTFAAWLMGFGQLLALWLVVRIEQPADWRTLFLLDRPDWSGFWRLLAIFGFIIWLESLFLNKLLWDPIQDWLVNLGFWTELSIPTPPRAYLGLNLVVLVLISWIEIPEEIYFRGYLQRQLTMRLGAFWGILLANLIWDLWHIWNPAMFVRRFFITLPYGIIVHLRGRVWAPMLVHPLGNRIGMILQLISH